MGSNNIVNNIIDTEEDDRRSFSQTSPSSNNSNSSNSIQPSSSNITTAAALDNNNSQQQQQQQQNLPIFIENNVFCSQCSASFTPNKPLLRCSGCDLVWYCGPEHQQLDWFRHKDFCKQIQADKRAQESIESQSKHQTAGNNQQQPGQVERAGMSQNGRQSQQQTAKQSEMAPAYVDQDSPTVITQQGEEESSIFSSSSTTTGTGTGTDTGTGSSGKTVTQPSQVTSTKGDPETLLGHQTQIFGDGGQSKTKRKCSNDDDTNSMTVKGSLGEDDIPSNSPSSASLTAAEDAATSSGSNKRKKVSKDAQRKDHSLNRPYNVTVDEHIESCLATCPTMTRYQAFCSRIQEIACNVMKSLTEYGWCAVDNFLGEAHAAAILLEIEELYKEDKFSLGPLMKQQAHPDSTRSKDIRSDYVLWFDNTTDEGSRAVNVNFLISMLDSVLVQIASNMNSCKINGRSRAMMAVYPGSGSRYVKHVDNPVEDGRVITTIYYLNKDWVPADGGSLRLYPESATSSIDVAPRFDRLFLFWSDKRNPHEVMPTFKHRYAVTVWYFDEKEKQRAQERQKRSKTAASASRKNDAHYQFPSPRPSSYVPPLPATNFSRHPSSGCGGSNQQTMDGQDSGESIPGRSSLQTLIEAAHAAAAASESQQQQQQQQQQHQQQQQFQQQQQLEQQQQQQQQFQQHQQQQLQLEQQQQQQQQQLAQQQHQQQQQLEHQQHQQQQQLAQHQQQQHQLNPSYSFYPHPLNPHDWMMDET